MTCISLWKAAVVYVLSIFMSGYLAVPKMQSCMPKPVFTHTVVKAAVVGTLGTPAPPQKQDEKFVLIIVGLIAVVVIGIIVYGIIKMALRIPAPNADPPPPPATNQPPVAYVPGPYLTDLKDTGVVKLGDRYPAIETPEQPIYCCNVSTNGWLDQFQYYFNTNAGIAIFTNAFCISLQGSENLKDWRNRINFVFYESTSGGILQAGFSNNVPVSSVYYKNSSYMDGQHYGRYIHLDAKPAEFFRLVSMTNYPTQHN